MTPTTEAPKCPTCGARILRTELSLCAYCGSPLSLGSPQTTETVGQHAERLAKMTDHKNYEPAMSWTPPEMLEVREAARRRKRGVVLLVVGVALSVVFWVDLGGTVAIVLATASGLGFMVLGARLIAKASGERSRRLALPLMKRPAFVADRGSKTSMNGRTGHTTYFFTLEFADGGRGEFRFHGRGAAFEPMASGATGIAYTRGQDLLAFQSIRV